MPLVAWNWSRLDWDVRAHRMLFLCYLADVVVWSYRVVFACCMNARTESKREQSHVMRDKFKVGKLSQAALVLHLVAGMTELVVGFVAVFTMHPVAIQIVAYTALCVHVPTAMVMTPTVYGSRRIMRPAYIAMSFAHAYCAVWLLMEPSSLEWLVGLLIVVHTYVWVRVFFFILLVTKSCTSAAYTLSVVLAGYVTLPYTPRLNGNNVDAIITGFILSYAMAEYLFCKHVLHHTDEELASEETDIDDADNALLAKNVKDNYVEMGSFIVREDSKHSRDNQGHSTSPGWLEPPSESQDSKYEPLLPQ